MTSGKRIWTSCSVPECRKPHDSKGMCRIHYQRFRKHGSTDLPARKVAGVAARGNSSGPCCPACGHESCAVVDSRFIDGVKRRRRACPSCSHRFTTQETVVGSPTKLDTDVIRALVETVDALGDQLDTVRSLLTEMTQ